MLRFADFYRPLTLEIHLNNVNLWILLRGTIYNETRPGKELSRPCFVVERYMESEGDAGLEDSDLLGTGGLMAE